MPKTTQTDTKLFAVLLTLCLIPVLSGTVRLFSLAAHGPSNPENLIYLANPLPIILHMTTYMAFCVIGTFQIAPVFRRRHLKLHRIFGRVLLPVGVIAASSGIWMTLTQAPIISNGEAVGYVRILFGFGMIIALILGFSAIPRRDFTRHQLWMLRSYAIALGASMQALVAIPWIIWIGEPQGVPWASAMFCAWLFNLAVVEWVTRTRPINKKPSAI